MPPIYQAVTFHMDDAVHADLQHGGFTSYWYTRYRNPTVDAAGERIAQLERAPAALMTSSGMAAISASLLAVTKAGARVLAPKQIYGDTRDLLVGELGRFGVQTSFVDATDPSAWREAIDAVRPAVVYVETMSNPTLDVPDLADLAKAAHSRNAIVVVDNTFASPALCRPLELGADVVVHSVTKYLNGHSDVTAGAVVASTELIAEIQRALILFGGCLDPHAAYLVWRGLRTFELRIRQSFSSARYLAEALTDHPEVLRVIHPALPDYPGATSAARTLTSRDAALVTFVVSGGDERAAHLMKNLTIVAEATSLGGSESLISAPVTSSHLTFSAEQRREAGIVPGMLRVSCGLEDADLIAQDFLAALNATREPITSSEGLSS